MNKSEYQNPKYETKSNDQNLKFKIVSNFVLRISNFRQRGQARLPSLRSGVSGQALVTLLFFMLISLTITSAAIIIIIANSISVSKLQEGNLAYYTAESGVENALLRLLRNPTYTGETLEVGNGTATITVTGTNPKTVVVTGQNGNFKRTVSAQMTYSSGYYTFSNWEEL